MNQQYSMYKHVLVESICKEIYDLWESSQSLSGTVIFLYVAMDTMAYLNMPLEKTKNTRNDFQDWVGKYLRTDDKQAYQYIPKDVWAARCGKLHSFSASSDFGKKNKCNLYGYHDGSEYYYSPNESNLVMISVRRLIDDFQTGVAEFLSDALKEKGTKAKIDSRIRGLYSQYLNQTLPAKQP